MNCFKNGCFSYVIGSNQYIKRASAMNSQIVNAFEVFNRNCFYHLYTPPIAKWILWIL